MAVVYTVNEMCKISPHIMTLEHALIIIFIVIGLAVFPLKFGLWRYLSGRDSKDMGNEPED